MNNFDHVMTVGKLRELLANLPAELPVILSKDGEGNGYSPLADTSRTQYCPETTWSGWIYDDDADIEDDEDVPSGSVPALVLWPVN